MEYALILSMVGNLFLLFALIVQRAMLRQMTRDRDNNRRLFNAALSDLIDMSNNSIRRNPKTGRYMKKGR